LKRVIGIRRGNGDAGRVERFEVEYEERTTLLDALELIRTGRAPDLSYRHSCHHGSCGTCSVRVDGREILACLTRLSSLSGKEPLVEPLAAFNVVTDLVIDPGRLFRSLPEDSTYLRAAESSSSSQTSSSIDAAVGPVSPSDTPRVRFEDCIECGACVSACPITAAAGSDSFIGPAALAAVHRESINRPERKDEMLDIAALPAGVAACERKLECSRVCPRAVYPAKHIELMRRELNAPRDILIKNSGDKK